MTKRHLLLVLAIGAASAAFAAPPARLAQLPTRGPGIGGSPATGLSKCLVRPIQNFEAKVPAQEAGVLREISVVKGDLAKQDQVLGQIDASQPQMQKRVAEAEWRTAVEKAKSDVDIQVYTKAAEVSYKEWQKQVQANKNGIPAVTEVDVERSKLQFERAKLEIERAKMERKVAGFTANAKAVEVEAADEAIRRRKVVSPLDGEVVDVYVNRGEWVKPGDPVLRILQVSRLAVHGNAHISENPLGSITKGQTVKVIVEAGQKVPTEFEGVVSVIDPQVTTGMPGGAYLVIAEVENRKDANGNWLLLPGMVVKMVVK